MLIAGIVIGRITTAEKVVVKWRDATPISAEVKSPVPVVVRVPDSIKYITVYRDQMASPSNMSEVVEPPEIDTAASLAATVRDWNVERTYAGMLFKSDTLGTLNYSAKVQYNTLTSLKWEFMPKVKEVTITKERTIRPFVGVGYNTFNQMNATGGVFIKNIGLSATYISDFTERKNGVGIGIMIKI